MSLWGKAADPPLHAIHFGYTVGSALTPLMCAPFLSPDLDPCNYTINGTTEMPCDKDHTTADPGYFADNSRIEIPFAIAGCITCGVGIWFIILQCIGRPKGMSWHSPQKKNLREVFSPATCAGGRSGLGATVVALLVGYYVFLQASSVGLGTLNFTFANEQLNFSKQDASLMDFTSKICSMVSRALLIVISRFVSAPILLFYAVFGSATTQVLLAFVGTTDKTLFWVFAAMNAFISAGCWGVAFAFIDKYIVLYAFVVALTSVGAGLSGFAFQSLHGFLYENTIPESFYYLTVALAGVWVTLTIIMYLVASKLGYRHEVEEEKMNSVTDEEEIFTVTKSKLQESSETNEAFRSDEWISNHGEKQEQECTKL